MDKHYMCKYNNISSEMVSIENSIKELRCMYETSSFEKGAIEGMTAIIPERISTYLIDRAIMDRLKELILQLKSKKLYLTEMRGEIEKYLLTVDDEKTRTILREIYLNGNSQDAVAKMLLCSRSTVAQRLKRHWDREKQASVH